MVASAHERRQNLVALAVALVVVVALVAGAVAFVRAFGPGEDEELAASLAGAEPGPRAAACAEDRDRGWWKCETSSDPTSGYDRF